MSAVSPSTQLTPTDVEIASERDGKRYELIEGELKEKAAGTKALFIASEIRERLNRTFYPKVGFAVVEAMIYCFAQKNHGRKPDVVYITFDRLRTTAIPDGDLFLAPDLVVEVLSPGNSGVEVAEKLDEYLDAGVAMVWIANPERQTIRVYRNDGTTRLFRATDAIENEPLLPGFRLRVAEVFPETAAS